MKRTSLQVTRCDAIVDAKNQDEKCNSKSESSICISKIEKYYLKKENMQMKTG